MRLYVSLKHSVVMKKFKRIMVGLDGKSTDQIILDYIEKMKLDFDLHKIYFVHITEDLNLPKSDELLYSEQLAPKDESIHKILITDLESAFTNLEEMDYEVIVKDGDPSEELLKLINIKQIDLLVLGRKPKPGITYFSRQLASRAPCSVVFVPKSEACEFRKILVPLDFSRTSRHALEVAFTYKNAHNETELVPVHFYSVPSGYSKTGKSFEQFASILKKNIKRKFKRLIPGYQQGKFDIILDKEENIAKKIFDYSLRKKADLIMIGSKGRTKIASFLSGSVAAKLVEISYHLPVLIDKKKGSILGAFGAFKKI